MKFTEISAFGRICKRDQPARVAFDENFTSLKQELGAAFVLQFTLKQDGRVLLRQSARSRNTGLVLCLEGSGFECEKHIKSGRVYDLTKPRSGEAVTLVEIRLPGSEAVLTVKHKIIGRRSAFSLNWSANG